ncbi:MAG: GGDEF domain-containing protein [Actinomycetota bacterium]
MRLVRLAALFGSVVLLVTVSVSMFDLRSERRSEIDAAIEVAAAATSQEVDATMRQATALIEAANSDTDPAAIAAAFVEPVSVCVVSADGRRCTGRDLAAGSAFGQAAEQAGATGGAVPIAQPENRTVLVVGDTADGATTVIELGAAALTPSGLSSDARIEVRVLTEPGAASDEPQSVDGQRVMTLTTLLAAGGAIEVAASADGDVGLVGDGLMLYGLLFVLGTILVALAGWTFLVDRRSLEHRASTDELTGLVNRREFERRSEEELDTAVRIGTGVCLMLIDLNGFKQINDTLGHQFGDLVLTACAERLTAAVRDTDLVGRWGGDEFVILLPGLQDASAVRASAERIAGRLSASPVVGDVTVTASIGAALYPRHGATLDDLIRGADVAMYGAKSTGVVHRMADPINLDTMSPLDVVSRDYAGPDRRRPAHPVADDDLIAGRDLSRG